MNEINFISPYREDSKLKIGAAIDRVADALFALRDESIEWRRSMFHVPRPEPFTITLISERRENDMDLLTYEATLPAMPAGTDVVSQAFDVSVDGAARPTQTLGKDATTATFEVPQDTSVDLKLTYVDDAGNQSQPQTQTFVAKDTIAPSAPGDFGAIKLVSERTE